jgi:hypothetical protein
MCAFEQFGGTPIDKIRYDNLQSAVSRVLFGRDRAESQRWIAFRSSADVAHAVRRPSTTEVERLTSASSWRFGVEGHAGMAEEAGEKVGLLLAGASPLFDDVGEVVDAVDGVLPPDPAAPAASRRATPAWTATAAARPWGRMPPRPG